MSKFNTGKTGHLGEMIQNCDNPEDLKEYILNEFVGQKQLWIDKINEILTENNYSQSKLAELCDVSRATVLKWVRGSIPQSRNMFIRIGLAAHYTLDEMNKFLLRYGRYPELYAKSPEDSVYMFVLNSFTIDHTYEACKTVFEKVDLSIIPKENRTEKSNEAMSTQLFTGYLLGRDDIPQLKQFIDENVDEFRSSYNDFYTYVRDFIRENNVSYQYYDGDINLDSVNLLAETLGWSSSLRKFVYSIFKGDWVPRRNKVISLGIHLNMNVDQINKLLQLAKMEELYPVNPTEGLLMYAIYDADLSDEISLGTDDLYNHVMEIFDEFGEYLDDSTYLSLDELLN